MVYLVRHGETDYSEKGTKIYNGFGENLVPLTLNGIIQIKNTAKDKRLQNASIILSSPYTRAIQTAAILSKELQIDIKIETDLHEWIANKNYIVHSSDQGEKNLKEFNDYYGEYPNGIERDWENNSRLFSVLKKYNKNDDIIVVCHGILIHSVYNHHWAENGEIIEFEMEDEL